MLQRILDAAFQLQLVVIHQLTFKISYNTVTSIMNKTLFKFERCDLKRVVLRNVIIYLILDSH